MYFIDPKLGHIRSKLKLKIAAELHHEAAADTGDGGRRRLQLDTKLLFRWTHLPCFNAPEATVCRCNKDSRATAKVASRVASNHKLWLQSVTALNKWVQWGSADISWEEAQWSACLQETGVSLLCAAFVSVTYCLKQQGWNNPNTAGLNLSCKPFSHQRKKCLHLNEWSRASGGFLCVSSTLKLLRRVSAWVLCAHMPTPGRAQAHAHSQTNCHFVHCIFFTSCTDGCNLHHHWFSHWC